MFKIDMLTCRSVQATKYILVLGFDFFFLFQFTRSHRGEKEKAPEHDDSNSEVEVDERNLSLMDRTKRMAKAAKEQQLQQSLDASLDGEVQDLEEMVRHTRERVQAAKAARSRAAALRLELQQLEEEERAVEADPAPAPVSATDSGAFVSASLKSAVRFSLSTFIFSFHWPLASALNTYWP